MFIQKVSTKTLATVVLSRTRNRLVKEIIIKKKLLKGNFDMYGKGHTTRNVIGGWGAKFFVPGEIE